MSQCLTCKQIGRISSAKPPRPVYTTASICIRMGHITRSFTFPYSVTAFRYGTCWILPSYPSGKFTLLRSKHLLQSKALLMPNNTVYLSFFNAASRFCTHFLISAETLIKLDFRDFFFHAHPYLLSLTLPLDFFGGSNLSAHQAALPWRLKVVSSIINSHSVLFSSFIITFVSHFCFPELFLWLKGHWQPCLQLHSQCLG